ncbi:zinc-binding protein A33-like isoform 1-T2 [Pholidichthys leucotaenia]
MSFQIDDDLCCPVCQDIFSNPVILSCSHSFCKVCLQSWWTQRLSQNCPVCKKVSLQKELPCNLALKKLCESYLEGRVLRSSADSEALCGLHSEKLTLFCLDHQEPVCLICRDSEKHTDHSFRPVSEAAEQLRLKILTSLKPLNEKLKTFKQAKLSFGQTADYIQVQARRTEWQIREQFKKLHLFLDDEEEARLSALKEEEEQKVRRINEKMEDLEREVSPVMIVIRATEEELRTSDVSFLRNYKSALKRVKRCPSLDDPQHLQGVLIDQTKHLGNLIFNIWSKMKDIVTYTPLILDPNTADPELALSENLTAVKRVEKEQLPQNPERFQNAFSVLGSEGFDSGTHSWDVEVGESTHWRLGVLAESVPVQSGLWTMWFFNGIYGAQSPFQSVTALPLQKKPQKIRMKLDWTGGTLSFSDPDTNVHIHTFTHTFTHKMFPYIKTWEEVRIVPLSVSVRIKADEN